MPYPGVTDKAGCLLHSLLNNHGFHDASKRTAWIICNAFLFMEDHALILPRNYPWYDRLAQMVDEGWDVDRVTRWIAPYVSEIDT